MSTQEGQEIIEKWKEELASYEKFIQRYGEDGRKGEYHVEPVLTRYSLWQLIFDAKDHPEVARELSTMFLNAIDKLSAKERDRMLSENLYNISLLSRSDYRILDDVLKFADERKIKLYIDGEDCDRNKFILAMNEGKISPKLLMKNLSNGSLDAMAFCVAKDPSLVEGFFKADKAVKEDKDRYYKYEYNPKALYQLSTQLDKLPEKMTPWLVDEIEKSKLWKGWYQETLFNVAHHNPKYLVKFNEMGYALSHDKDAIFVAKLYEDLQNRVQDTLTEKDVKKNRPTSSLTKEEQELSKSCEDLLKGYKDRVALKAKLAKKYPMSAETLGVNNDDYISMCINNLENPENENIRSILNRLEAMEAKTFEDFVDAVDFVHRRDLCKKACYALSKAENDKYKEEYPNGIIVIREGPLSYDMAEAGIKDKKTAEKVVELFYNLNERPATYESPYNKFYPEDLIDMTDMEEWMYPVIRRAVYDGMVSPRRLGGGKDLFAACKAWNINPKMPKAIAEQVGEMSLAKRMVAGAIVDDMARAQIKAIKENKDNVELINKAIDVSPNNTSFFARVYAGMNHNKELIPEFWKEMSKAQEMSFGEAMKTYIPDTPINRKRFVAAMLEEMGVENTEAKYQQTYKNLEENGKFEEFLASDSKEQKLERIKQNKAKVQEKSTKKKSIREAIRERLAKKNIIPETGAFGEGHKITANKDMSQFKAFVDEKSR